MNLIRKSYQAELVWTKSNSLYQLLLFEGLFTCGKGSVLPLYDRKCYSSWWWHGSGSHKDRVEASRSRRPLGLDHPGTCTIQCLSSGSGHIQRKTCRCHWQSGPWRSPCHSLGSLPSRELTPLHSGGWAGETERPGPPRTEWSWWVSIVQVCHLSWNTCLQVREGYPDPQEIPHHIPSCIPSGPSSQPRCLAVCVLRVEDGCSAVCGTGGGFHIGKGSR